MAVWNLQSPRVGPRGASSMTLQLTEDSSAGTLVGTLTYSMGVEGESTTLIVDPENGTYNHQSTLYNVSGTWTASYSQNQPDKKFTVFSLSGSDGADLPTFIAATGTMTGPGNAPTAIRIKVNTASSQFGTLTQDTLPLAASQ